MLFNLVTRAELLPEDAAQAMTEDATLTEKATVEAAEYLQRSGLEGAAKVTNVKVTTDEREVMRRHVCAAAALGYLTFIIDEKHGVMKSIYRVTKFIFFVQ